MSRLLTIGMATYDDFDGLYMTIQCARIMNPEVMDEVEFLVIDNNPEGAHSKAIQHFLNSVPNSRYVPFTKWNSTTVKGQVFKEAQTPYVLCVDSHVILPPGTLGKLIQYYIKHPDTKDLLQGPLLYDNLVSISTHLDPVWRGQMWGTWGTDERGRDIEAEPFEIPMQGCGLLSCRKDAWVGFNEQFRGFGGEEGYIQEKFRQAGGKVLCLPFLRWVHRFGRPKGVPYHLSIEDKVRNYLIGFIELKLPLDPVINHFCEFMAKGKILDILQKVESDVAGKPLVSCIMPTYNRLPQGRRLLEETVECFLRQDYPNKELLIVNDCAQQEITFEHPNVRVFNLTERFGSLGEKLNWAITQAKGSLICRFDDDDISLPWRLRVSVEKLQDAAYWGSIQYWFDDKGSIVFNPGNSPLPSAAIFTKDIWTKVGGYPSKSLGEDMAFEDKIKISGYRFKKEIIDKRNAFYLYRWATTGCPHLSGAGGVDVYKTFGERPVTPCKIELEPKWIVNYSEITRQILDKEEPTTTPIPVPTTPPVKYIRTEAHPAVPEKLTFVSNCKTNQRMNLVLLLNYLPDDHMWQGHIHDKEIDKYYLVEIKSVKREQILSGKPVFKIDFRGGAWESMALWRADYDAPFRINTNMAAPGIFGCKQEDAIKILVY